MMEPFQNQKIQQLIANAILEHRLVPGQHLNEAQLSKAFGVSRSVVRIALISLESQGLIQIAQNRGAFVAKPSLEQAVQLFQALATLEKAAAELILAEDRKARMPDLSSLEAIHVREQDAQRRSQHADAVSLSIDFHMALVALTDNCFLLEAHRKLLMQYRLVTAVFRTSMDYCALEDHHIRMIEFLQEGAPAKLKRLIDAHWSHIVLGHAPIVEQPTDLLIALKV